MKALHQLNLKEKECKFRGWFFISLLCITPQILNFVEMIKCVVRRKNLLFPGEEDYEEEMETTQKVIQTEKRKKFQPPNKTLIDQM